MQPVGGSCIPGELIYAIHQGHNLVVMTGSGISAESGIPTFRDAQNGLWSKYKPEDLATPNAFRSNPKLVWEWYQWRRNLVSKAKPHPGHIALAKIESHITQVGSGFTLITQNVDGLHQRAGSCNVLELHGNIMRDKCTECKRITHLELNKQDPKLPQCQYCDGLLRPDVVWYGESLPQNVLNAAWKAVEGCDVFFSIGTSTIVQPAASLPMIAYQNGATIIEINPNRTPLTQFSTFSIHRPAGEVLPELETSVLCK